MARHLNFIFILSTAIDDGQSPALKWLAFRKAMQCGTLHFVVGELLLVDSGIA